MEKTNEKACLECGDTFRGRSDKKFCGDQCRNVYNNRCTQESNSFMRGVNHILRKNRKILEELVPEEPIKVSKRRLYEKGFNFEFTTSMITSREGNIFYYCYEFGYQALENDIMQLVKRSDCDQN
jgi:hypothetical protein